MKKLLLLGGLIYLKPVIEIAHKLGVHVITCDYLPDNVAHKYSDEYHNVSIVDKDAVLKLARELQIDGIMSFAVDPGVATAAYVAEEMGLPSAGSYKAIHILQNKDLFRKFLEDNGFNVPASGGYTDLTAAMEDLHRYSFPIIVKPTDSAGSKGVTRVDSPAQLEAAFKEAKENSISGHVIIEEFIEKSGCSSDCDSFSVDGQMVLTTFNAQRFDDEAANPYTPSAYSWPSTFTPEEEQYLAGEIQRLVTLLGLRTSIYNIETRIGTDGKPYIMELSPRGGGNRLAEMERLISGNDMIEAAVRGALGMPVNHLEQKELNGHWAEIVLHSEADGIFDRVEIREDMLPFVAEKAMLVTHGDRAHAFRGANDSLGTLVMKFPSDELLQKALATQHEWLKIHLA